tara:strand:- start:824 stop:1054 length:231 start_codon:yes stop_codon:yes gene_type:complete
MNFWESPIIKSLGWKEEPKGVAKVMSVCMLIVITTIFIPSSISSTKIGKIIIFSSIFLFLVLLIYVLLKRFLSKTK